MQPGQIVLFRFPHSDLEEGKLRPALLLGKLPGEHGDFHVMTREFESDPCGNTLIE